MGALDFFRYSAIRAHHTRRNSFGPPQKRQREYRSTGNSDVDSGMRQALCTQSRRNACPLGNVDSTLLEHTGADAAQHMLRAAPLKNDGIDTRLMQQLTEQQTGRSGADDGNLCSQEFLFGTADMERPRIRVTAPPGRQKSNCR
jgi:hypothetical protein